MYCVLCTWGQSITVTKMQISAKYENGASKNLVVKSYFSGQSFNASLKLSKDLNSAGSTFSLFQSLMVRGKNVFVYTEVLVVGITKRDEWPLVEVVR